MITKIYIVYNIVPYIVIETSDADGGVLRDEIEFNELNAYIALFTAQRATLGKYVAFSKGTFTFNQNLFAAIVIESSDSPAPPPPATPINLTMTVDGVDFNDDDNSLAGLANVDSITGGKVVNASNVPFVFEFYVPSLTQCQAKFEDEYSAVCDGDGWLEIVPYQDGQDWYCIGVFVSGTTDQTADIQSQAEFIEIVNMPDVTNAFAQDYVIIRDSEDAEHFIQRQVYPIGNKSTYIQKPNTRIFLKDRSGSQIGLVNVVQYDVDGNVLGSTLSCSFNKNIPLVSAAVTRITMQFQGMFFSNDATPGNIFYYHNFGGGDYGGYKPNAASLTRFDFALKGAGGWVNLGVADALQLPIAFKLYKQGVEIASDNLTQPNQDFTGVASDWDTIVLGGATPPASGTATADNQQGAAPGETAQIDNITVNGNALTAISFPVLPLENKNGSYAIPTGGIASVVQVAISGAGVVPPTTVRLIDGASVNHDLPFVGDALYSFLSINVSTTFSIVLF
jgi:hypothetical protein